MDRLYSDDPAVRERDAAKYRVFHKKVSIPSRWKGDWNCLLNSRDANDGLKWPESLLRILRTRKWPEYTFGTANASCLVVLNRPGDPSANSVEETFIPPNLPVLGGIPHPHNAFWYPSYNNKPTWGSLHRYLVPAFARLKHPWSQVMTTNLTTTPARTGTTDSWANLRAVNSGLLQFLVNLCQPRVVLLCGDPVQKAAVNWSPPASVEVVRCQHPSYQHWSGDGPRVQATIKKILFR